MERFKELVEQAPDGVVILEAGRVVFINATAARLLGVAREVALGQPIGSFLPPADAALAGERIGRMMHAGRETAPNEYGTLADPDRVVEIKAMRWEWEGRPAVLAFARDVTERKALEQHLLHADRLAAVGTLAGGIAHEVNNPLTYVQLSLQLIDNTLADVPGARELIAEYLKDAQHGLDRVASITRSLRMFAQEDDAAPSPVDPAVVVDRALKFVENDLRHRARLERHIANVPWVLANQSRLEQVVVNLLLNALQSLQGREDDTITVEIASGNPGEVVIRVTDTGAGIAATVRDRVFDPFFTTKASGVGMGLGLAVSRSIVEAIGGRIQLSSIDGTGTTATVVLRAHQAPKAKPLDTLPGETGPRRRVLVVDDEPLLRTLLCELLAAHHEITEVATGENAVAAATDHEFDVILCDVMMPGLNGVDVYRRIAETRPGMERRIVFITGGTFMTTLADAVHATGATVLSKPFQIKHVLATIAAISSAA